MDSWIFVGLHIKYFEDSMSGPTPSYDMIRVIGSGAFGTCSLI